MRFHAPTLCFSDLESGTHWKTSARPAGMREYNFFREQDLVDSTLTALELKLNLASADNVYL